MGNKLKSPRANPSQPGVIPTSQVIVLKEQELDCDLATAIQRIRANDETSHSRILVVAADDEVESEGAEQTAVHLPATAPTTVGQIARRGQDAALREFGDQLAPLEASLHRYLVEMESALEQLERCMPAGPHAATVEPLRLLSSAVEWSQALGDDLSERVQRARNGFCRVDARELWVDMAAQIEASYPGVRVTVGPAREHCHGQPAALAEAFYLGLVLVAHRIGGRGAVSVEIERTGDTVVHHVRGGGEPVQVVAPECIHRFRELIVDLHGGRVEHDELGPGGTGLAICLPLQ